MIIFGPSLNSPSPPLIKCDNLGTHRLVQTVRPEIKRKIDMPINQAFFILWTSHLCSKKDHLFAFPHFIWNIFFIFPVNLHKQYLTGWLIPTQSGLTDEKVSFKIVEIIYHSRINCRTTGKRTKGADSWGYVRVNMAWVFSALQCLLLLLKLNISSSLPKLGLLTKFQLFRPIESDLILLNTI